VRRSRETTLILVTHDSELAALADTRLVLRDGRSVADAALRLEPAAGRVSP
jgi:ABC-type lipoprotein export system ATPase subunit